MLKSSEYYGRTSGGKKKKPSTSSQTEGLGEKKRYETLNKQRGKKGGMKEKNRMLFETGGKDLEHFEFGGKSPLGERREPHFELLKKGF